MESTDGGFLATDPTKSTLRVHDAGTLRREVPLHMLAKLARDFRRIRRTSNLLILVQPEQVLARARVVGVRTCFGLY